MINVVLAEDHEVVRKGISALIKNDEINIIGEAENGLEALEKIGSLCPDIVLMDISMPVMDGLECTRLCKEKFPGVKILILSMHQNESCLIEMLEAGADGYALKNASRNELLFAIKNIYDKGMYIAPQFTTGMLEKYQASKGFLPKKTESVQISPREMDVLHLIADGLTNVEIANKLFTSRRTIETHRKRLLEKTHTFNTATLMKFAVLNGLIK